MNAHQAELLRQDDVRGRGVAMGHETRYSCAYLRQFRYLLLVSVNVQAGVAASESATLPQAQQAAYQAALAQVLAQQQHAQQQQSGLGPQHMEGRHGMLLCRVVLGRIAQGTGGLRRPPTGADSVTQLVPPDPHRVLFLTLTLTLRSTLTVTLTLTRMQISDAVKSPLEPCNSTSDDSSRVCTRAPVTASVVVGQLGRVRRRVGV